MSNSFKLVIINLGFTSFKSSYPTVFFNNFSLFFYLKKTNNFLKMKKAVYFIFIIAFLLSCKPYSKDKNGISLKIKESVTNSKRLIRIDVLSDDIIHVKSFPTLSTENINSLIVDSAIQKETIPWAIEENDSIVILVTKKLKVHVNKESGAIQFTDLNGNTILTERKNKASQFKSKTIDGNNYFEIQQVFDSPENEAFYGLGQHQNGLVNYKGHDIDLFQHNIDDVVPFLVSSKNYGILWDNYSRSKFGDPRDFMPLSVLKVYDENGLAGGLTARYYTTYSNSEIFVTRQESEIRYKYLDELKKFPEKFPLGTGKVEWKGFLEANTDGLYKFQAYSAGFMKIWLNDSLIFDSWRQCWNPWSRNFSLEMKQGTKIPLTIEWIPDGGESYIALECLTPYEGDEMKELSLWSEAAKAIDYYFVYGSNIDEVISGYRKLTGKSPIMPNWAMGLWQSRERYKTQEELLGVVKEYRKRNIPLDNIVLDWHYWEEDKWGDHSFEPSRFQDPKKMMDELHNDLHANIMISVWPKYYVGTKNYDIMEKNGWLYMENINNKQKDWVGPGYVSTFFDVFNKDARKEFWKQINDSLFSKGIDGWWLDATEPDILSNTSFEARKKLMSPTALGDGSVYFNAFSLMQSKGVYEGQRGTDPNKRVFILTRSAFAGQQRYAAATWSGDVASRWSDLKEQIAAGLNFSMSGIPYWTTDIGGFSLERRYIDAKGKDLNEWRELNLRWYQFGVFCPLFRIHGQYPYREIYNTSPENNPVYKSMVYYDNLRYQLMPYIYSLAGMTYHNDYTIMRPLIMDHYNDVKVTNINDEYMFGPSMLVCPIYVYKAQDRSVYFPSTSNWYDLLTGEFFEGGKEYLVKAPLEKIPVFVREGSIVPVGPVMQYTGEIAPDSLTIYVYKGADGQFTLYEDDGTSYDYEKGLYSTIHFSYINSENKLILDERKGQFPGMLNERIFNIVIVSKENIQGLKSTPKISKTVKYDGKPISLEL